ncbi:MAG: isoprenylcysteine carboxylmethyltransferase family protein [Actinomycetales bacterium]|nr:isoprenylcysteine carboxylmethyltransferase family protein [Actinomycetales bacterium]
MNIRTVLDKAWRDEGRIPPPVLFAGAWLAQSLASSRRAGVVPRALGAVVGLGSVALAASAAAGFARRGTTLDPLVPDAQVLVTTGANAVSRNPMYTGLLGALTARALSRGSALALAPVVAVAYLLETRQIPAEEKVLTERFGAEYEAYRESTPRWLDARSAESLRALAQPHLPVRPPHSPHPAR